MLSRIPNPGQLLPLRVKEKHVVENWTKWPFIMYFKTIEMYDTNSTAISGKPKGLFLEEKKVVYVVFQYLNGCALRNSPMKIPLRWIGQAQDVFV